MPRFGSLEAACLLLLVIFGLVIFTSFNDSDAIDEDAKIYCANVHDHTWPDFKENYKRSCLKDGSVKP
jgi:hypothetical protein